MHLYVMCEYGVCTCVCACAHMCMTMYMGICLRGNSIRGQNMQGRM